MAFNPYDLISASLLGIICGGLGSLYNAGIAQISKHRNRLLRSSLPPHSLHTRRILQVVLVSVVVAPIIFLELSMGFKEDYDGPLTYAIFQSSPWPDMMSLLIYTPCKFLMTIISITLPLPVGLFTPSFLTGGAIGRVFGEALTRTSIGPQLTFSAWQFAVIGAAAFVSGTTRTISTSVVVFELGRNNTTRLPVTAAILLANVITSKFIKNIYDLMIDTNGVPYLPDLPEELYFVQASQVMRPIQEEKFLTLQSTYRDLEDILTEMITTKDVVPVVDSIEGMHFEGVVRLQNLRDSLMAFCTRKEDLTMRNWLQVTTEQRVDEEEAAGWEEDEQEEEGEGRRRERRPSLLDAIKAMEETPLHYVWIAAGKVQFYSVGSRNSSAAPSPFASPALSFFPQRSSEVDIILDCSAPTHADSTFLCKVEMSFRMLKLSEAWVVKSGRLVGVISREALADFIIAREHEFRPIQRCFQFFGACTRFFCCNPSEPPSGNQHRGTILGAPVLYEYNANREESKADRWREQRRLPVVM